MEYPHRQDLMNSSQRRQPKSENRQVTRAAGVVGAATLLSRIFGYVRDMVLASFFGAGMAADAFIAAFRIPNLLRRLFGEGSLSLAFVPVFYRCHGQRGPRGGPSSGHKFVETAAGLSVGSRHCRRGGRSAHHTCGGPRVCHASREDGPDGDPDPHHVPLRDPDRAGGSVYGDSQCAGALCRTGRGAADAEPGHDRCRLRRVPVFPTPRWFVCWAFPRGCCWAESSNWPCNCPTWSSMASASGSVPDCGTRACEPSAC